MNDERQTSKRALIWFIGFFAFLIFHAWYEDLFSYALFIGMGIGATILHVAFYCKTGEWYWFD